MFHYGNLRYWRETAQSDNTDNLSSRAFLLMIQLAVSQEDIPAQSRGEQLLARLKTIGPDALQTFRRHITFSYDRSTNNQLIGCFLDAYDLLAASIAYLCLQGLYARKSQTNSFPSTAEQDPVMLAELIEVVHKASTLVTQISSRFPTFEGVHGFLFDLYQIVLDTRVSIAVYL